jgi:hypothetical protein
MDFPETFKEELSNRALTVLTEGSIFSLEVLIAFYCTHRSFLIIPSCGIKTNKELSSFTENQMAELGDVKVEEIKHSTAAPDVSRFSESSPDEEPPAQGG